MSLPPSDSYQTEAGVGAGAASLCTRKGVLVGQAVTWVTGGEEAVAAGHDCLVFQELCHMFTTENRQNHEKKKTTIK